MNNLSKYFDLENLRKMDEYEKAKVIVYKLFSDITDKGGDPYINHLYYVSNNLDTKLEKIVGLLHDIVEDTEITFDDLKEIGFCNEVINSLKIITKNEGELYSNFIDRIISSNDLVALNVKIKDMENNMDLKRLSKLNYEDKKRLENKYKPEYKKLIKRREEIK